MHTTPLHRRALLRGALLATAAVTAAAGLAACSSGGSSGTTAAAAQSAANRIASAASSGAASVSSNPTTSSDGGANGGSDTSTSCNIVSKQQLASILHHAVTDVSSVAGGCIATDASNPSEAYSFGVRHDAGCWARATSVSGTPVSGIGDAAVGSGLGLQVKHGSTCISAGGGTAAETHGDFRADIAVARIILGKLG